MNMSDLGSPPPLRRRRFNRRLFAGVGAGILVVVAFAFFIVWFVVRVEVGAGQILILVNKTGRTVPADVLPDSADQVVLYEELIKAIAANTGETEDEVLSGYKGIRLRVLPAGRYFPNPYSYERIIRDATVIGPNEVGILIRKFGKPLPFPKTVATESDERGPVAQYLTPARHNINTLAYEVQKYAMAMVPEGHAGVVTLLSGRDPKTKNTYTVEPGEKGVQRETLPSGRHPYNPYLERIDVVDMRSHKYEMLGDQAIHFPSNDSFTIDLEGYIEWAIRPDRVAQVTVAYGDEEDILNKVILPNARSISRIQGSKLRAREFIGKTRLQFQERLLAELKRECSLQGIEIKSAAITEIKIPTEIASLISAREQADQEMERYDNEIGEAQAEVLLVGQQELQAQNAAIGDARRGVVTVTKKADQQRVIDVTQAEQEFEVAKLDLQAAEKLAEATRAKGRAEANVILFDFKARAEPLRTAVQAFGDGETYAQQFFLKKVAPAIQTILSNTEGPFADIFKQFQSFDTVRSSAGLTDGAGGVVSQEGGTDHD